MRAKTKWMLAAALGLCALAIAFFFLRPRDEMPPEPGPAPAAEEVAVGAPEGRAALAAAAAEAATDAGTIPPALLVALQKPPKVKRVMPYRPARLLVYSEDPVSMDPARDYRAWALNRILETTHPDPGQAERIRELWRTHEDGRRFLWVQAVEHKSRDRILDPGMVAQLDGAFESDLLNKVLNTEQGQLLLAETGRAQPP